MTKSDEINKYLLFLKDNFTQKAKELSCVACLGNLKLNKNLRHVRCTRRGCRKTIPITTSLLFFKSKLKNEIIIKIIQHLVLDVPVFAISKILNVGRNAIRKIRKEITLIYLRVSTQKKLLLKVKES